MIFPNCLTTILLAIAVSLLLDASTCYANPGISVRVTQNGFNYATEVALEKFYEDFKDKKIPDLEKNSKINVSISNIQIASDTKPTARVTLAPGQGLTWHLKLDHFRLTGIWRYSKKVPFLIIRHTGFMDVRLSHTYIDVTIVPFMGSYGRLNLLAIDCSCRTDLNVHTSNWLLRIIFLFFKGRLQSRLEAKICESATVAINNKLTPKLTNYRRTKTVAKDYVFDYNLESEPIINSGYLQTNHKGKVYYKGDTRPIPFSPNSFPTIHENNKMIYFIISNYLFETWFFAAHRNQLLQYHIRAQNAHGKDREMLRTTCPDSYCLGSVIPQFAKTFPNSMIQLSFTTSDRPRMNFLPNRIQIVVPTVLKFDVIQSNATAVNAFSLHMKIFFEMKARLSNNTFYLSLSNSTFTFDQISGVFKDEFNVEPLQQALGYVAESLKPFIEEVGSQGMPIMLPEKTFIENPEFHVVNNAIILGADLKIVEF